MVQIQVEMGRETYQEIELRSEEVQEILSRPPHALVRWGITVFFAVIVLLFVGGCFFNYPDVVTAEITITTERPPIWMVARGTGKLKEIFKEDLQKVAAGEVVAVLENPAVTADVLELKNLLYLFSLTDSAACQTDFPTGCSLGDIQNSYHSFLKCLTEYQDFIRIDLYTQKETAAREELREYGGYIEHLNRQAELNKEELKIAETTHLREKTLYVRNVTSLADYEEAQQVYLTRRQGMEQQMISLASARIEQARLQQNIVEIQMQRSKEMNILLTTLKAAYDELRMNISRWELTYLFVTPAAGILSYNQVWQENQEINTGDKVFSVVAAETGDVMGKMNLPVSGAGKVKPGQRVNISVTDYPYMEYGYLTGTVVSTSLLSDENKYTVTVRLPQDLRTSYHKRLNFKGELSGTAEVMTDERSLTVRLISPLRYLWEKHLAI